MLTGLPSLADAFKGRGSIFIIFWRLRFCVGETDGLFFDEIIDVFDF